MRDKLLTTTDTMILLTKQQPIEHESLTPIKTDQPMRDT